MSLGQIVGRRARKQDDKSKKGGQKKQGKKRSLNAKNADKYLLYQKSVQSVDVDVDFLLDTYVAIRGKKPRHLREDFCGTAMLAAEWVSRGESMTAEGFDIDPEPLAWGKKNNIEPLGEAASRVVLHQKDIREEGLKAPDIRTAPNFSYQCLQTRKEMLQYFTLARESLAEDGLFVLDLFGGPDAMMEMEEKTKLKLDGMKFTYVWDQAEYHPASGEYRGAIHFRFPDGSALENAFTYEWRFWFITELKDILYEAGFSYVGTYFEGEDDEDSDEGNGVFEEDDRGDNCMAWIAYLVARR